MGRYVTGINNGFYYKYAFGIQDSNLGEIIEEVFAEEDSVTVYVIYNKEQCGHSVEINARNREKFLNALKKWLAVNVFLKDDENEKATHYMVEKFYRYFLNDNYNNTLTFDSE